MSKYDKFIPEMRRLHKKGFGHMAIASILDIPSGSLSGYFASPDMRPPVSRCLAHKLKFQPTRAYKNFTQHECAQGCRLQQQSK